MSEDVTPTPDDQRKSSKGTEPDEQIVSDDESSYGAAGQRGAEGANHVDPGSGENRLPSELDEDQGI